MRKMRFIQIGLGGFGEYWCSEVLPYITADLGIAEIVAAVDINPDSFSNLPACAGLPAGKFYTDAKKAFTENEADFAIIVVPPAYHESMLELAIGHGCHVLLEKPIADDMETCCRIYRRVIESGKKVAVTMSHRYDQDKQTLEGLIKSGDFGKLSHIAGRFSNTYEDLPPKGNFRYTMDDPFLIECAIHHFEIMRSLSGANASTVYAKTWNPEWSTFRGDTTAAVIMEMTNGVSAVYEGSIMNSAKLNSWGNEYFRAECEKGTLELDHRVLTVKRSLDVRRMETIEIPLIRQRNWINPWLAELFVKWLTEDRRPPNTIDDNMQCAALLFAAVQSAHTGGVVDVQHFLKGHLKRVGLESPREV